MLCFQRISFLQMYRADLITGRGNKKSFFEDFFLYCLNHSQNSSCLHKPKCNRNMLCPSKDPLLLIPSSLGTSPKVHYFLLFFPKRIVLALNFVYIYISWNCAHFNFDYDWKQVQIWQHCATLQRTAMTSNGRPGDAWIAPDHQGKKSKVFLYLIIFLSMHRDDFRWGRIKAWGGRGRVIYRYDWFQKIYWNINTLMLIPCLASGVNSEVKPKSSLCVYSTLGQHQVINSKNHFSPDQQKYPYSLSATRQRLEGGREGKRAGGEG